MAKKKNRSRKPNLGSMARPGQPFSHAAQEEDTANVENMNALEPSPDMDELEAPEQIVATEAQARAMLNELMRIHSTRFSEFAKIQRQYYGNRPRNQEKLKEKGLDYLSNINNGHARIHINRYLSSEYNLIHGVPSPIHVSVRLIDPDTDNLIARAFERAFKKVYTEWEDYYTQLDAMRHDKTLFGLGVTTRLFDSKSEMSGWKFQCLSPDQFLCPLSSKISQGSLAKFCILYSKPAQELWEIYNDLADDDEDSPWNKEQLGWILWQASNQNANRGADSSQASWQDALLQMQRKIRNYEVSIIDYYQDDIKLASVYTKEWTGKWSHMIIHETISTVKPLFSKPSQYKTLNDFLQLWYFEPCNKTIHSVRGLGYRIFQPVEVQNRLDNMLIDQTAMAGTNFIRTRQGRGRDAKSVKINLGTFNDIGEAELIPQQLVAPNLDANLKVNQYQGQIIERNVQFEGHNIEEPDPKYRTLGEVGMQATRDAVITKPQVSYFYRQYDTFLQNTIRIAYSRKPDEFFEEFKEEILYDLKDLQLPEEVLNYLFYYPKDEKQLNRQGLPKWLRVKAARSTSSGSQVADIMASNRMFPLAQFMATEQRYTYLQDATAAYSDHDNVQRYFPDKNRPEVFTEPMQKAVMENAILTKLGTEVPVSPNDSHREEAPIHLKACQQIIQMWTEGMDAIQADDQLRQLYPHFVAHYVMMSENPLDKALFEQLGPIRGEVENAFRQIQANAENARLAQQKAEEKARLEAVQQELRLDPNSPESIKAQVDNELKIRSAELEENRKNRLNNIQAVNAQVKANVERATMITGFKNDERRKNIALIMEISEKNRKLNNGTASNAK